MTIQPNLIPLSLGDALQIRFALFERFPFPVKLPLIQ
jgi:hypothetical protein